VDIYGIDCTLYIPNNLTALEGNDAYTDPDTITYTEYTDQKIWIEWHAKDIIKLRKLGMFTENEAPITGWMKNSPVVTIRSYVVVSIRYVPSQYATDKFEVVDNIMQSTYSSEVLRRFKLAPLRKND